MIAELKKMILMQCSQDGCVKKGSRILKNSVHKVAVYLEMIKFEHSVFALPFAYMGLFLATSGSPSFYLFFWITIAMVSFRSMGMGMNRLIDTKIDALNPRTAMRALPAGKLSQRVVGCITGIFLFVFFLSAFFLSPKCFALAPIPVILAFLYPFAKRFTWLSHWILGIILGIAPYGAWLAARGTFSWIPGFLTIGVTVWVAGFDIIYALQDLQFDRKKGLFSFPSKFGERASLNMTFSLHFVALLSWLIVGRLADLGVFYYVGIVLAGFLLLREGWLVYRFSLDKIQEAFFVTNAIVSVSLFSFVLLDLWIS